MPASARAYALLTGVDDQRPHEVKSRPSEPLGPIAEQILGYLNARPDAQDTVEGIAEWWLVEQRIRTVITEVEKALAELMAQGLVLARPRRDGRIHYRLNRRKGATNARPLREKPIEPADSNLSIPSSKRDAHRPRSGPNERVID